jgi:hypothetical protein
MNVLLFLSSALFSSEASLAFRAGNNIVLTIPMHRLSDVKRQPPFTQETSRRSCLENEITQPEKVDRLCLGPTASSVQFRTNCCQGPGQLTSERLAWRAQSYGIVGIIGEEVGAVRRSARRGTSASVTRAELRRIGLARAEARIMRAMQGCWGPGKCGTGGTRV